MDKAEAKLLPDHNAIVDALIALTRAAGPWSVQTDKYFTNTLRIVAAHSDTEVTFSVYAGTCGGGI